MYSNIICLWFIFIEILINNYLQVVYFSISLINDFIGTNEYHPKKAPTVRKVKDYLFSSMCFPISFNVGISFWGIYIVDRELVCPEILDAIFPLWLNHMVHTNIMVFMILELFMLFRNNTSHSKSLMGLLSFMCSYLVWIHIIKHYSDDWVYPILEVLPMSVRIAFFAGCIALAVAFYFLGDFLNKMVWAKETRLGQHKFK
ncbi:hypothetical protein ACFFRR_005162 [Megaselia abdita]